MNVKDNILACYRNQWKLYFNVSITSRELQTSRLGLVSVSSFYVSCLSRASGYYCVKNVIMYTERVGHV